MSSFYELGVKHGTDKVTHHGYQFFYPRFLEPFRLERFTLLELGYADGASARMWEEYFPNAAIFAMDINKSGVFGRHEVIQGSQDNLEDLQRVVDRLGNARVIIDDASHHPVHQYESFNFFFRNLLEPGGVYIIEDTECNYWHPESSIYGYRIGFFNAIAETTKLVDLVNAEFSGATNELGVSSLSYGQNCIIITKQTDEERAYFDRTYAGQHRIDSPTPG